MIIHHYTSLQTLALILKNKTIRFNRLDLVDDASELDGIPDFFRSYLFASCWTESEDESIPLWKMYTPNMQGVKISLPKKMFREILIPAFTEANSGVTQQFYSPLTKEEMFTDDYFIPNLVFGGENNSFYKKVAYENNHAKLNQALFEVDHQNVNIKSIFDLGRYKHHRWAFQDESRFVLCTFPLLPLDHPLINGDRSKKMLHPQAAMFLRIPNKMNYIDVKLNDDVLNQIVVTTGPLCSEADSILAQALLEKYTLGGTLSMSSLCKTIRR